MQLVSQHVFSAGCRVWFMSAAVFPQDSRASLLGVMAKGRKFTPLLASRWERIARVRSRFRRGVSWLKYAKGAKNDDIVQCTPSLSCNYEILATALETCGLKLQSVKALEKEAGVSTYQHNCSYQRMCFHGNFNCSFPPQNKYNFGLIHGEKSSLKRLLAPARLKISLSSRSTSLRIQTRPTSMAGVCGGCWPLQSADRVMRHAGDKYPENLADMTVD